MREGRLSKNLDHRWEIHFDDEEPIELTCGSQCEIKVGDHWIKTTVEAFNGYYYSTVPGTRLMERLPARLGRAK